MISFIQDEKKTGRIHDMKILSEVISLFMGHRRKMLRACTKLTQGNLAKIHNWQTIFSDCLIDPHLRAEQLTPENFLSIANQCSEFLSQNNTRQ
jgi:16S rRNA A1518/A1519 N6-dimethyltransferase RsmA/KsgA/DIM1 with predicted DNA glycosylase/AP lyase activity